MTQVFGANLPDRRDVIEKAKTKSMRNLRRYSKEERFRRAVSLVSTSDVYFSIGRRKVPLNKDRVCRVLALLKNTELDDDDYKTYFAMISHIARSRLRKPNNWHPEIVFNHKYWVKSLSIAKKYGFERAQINAMEGT